MKSLEKTYPVCRAALSSKGWKKLAAACAGETETFAACAARQAGETWLPGFIPDLVRVEDAVLRAREDTDRLVSPEHRIEVNPTLHVKPVGWKHLAALFSRENKEGAVVPEAGEELLFIWRDPVSEMVKVEPAADADLLALKVTVEQIDSEAAAAAAGRPVGVIDTAVRSAIRRGILLSPPSRIRREAALWPAADGMPEKFLVSQGFTLQWHITQACDLHCRHCYDRSRRRAIPKDKALGLLEDLRRFCLSRFVSGHVSFTGGNPLLHPHFLDLYRAASEKGFTVSILGNPTTDEMLEKIAAIEEPYLFQVSLEGLEEHNDAIRGEGHFRSVMEFLPRLRKLGISSMVMLTLTEGNLDQVLPLCDELEGLVDDFTFNRLSMFGEGANLRLPDREKYEKFLEEFTARAEGSSFIGLKDNLINILRHRRRESLFGGCTGFGCGAAFNFITVLAEGEAHACRKLPSPIGDVLKQGIEGVYESEAARRYRAGCSACRECAIRPVCGGCLAVSSSHGLDPFKDRDPQCFIDTPVGKGRD